MKATTHVPPPAHRAGDSHASTALRELRRVRRWLSVGVVVRALAWAICATVGGLVLIVVVDALVPIPVAGRRLLLAVVVVIAAIVAAALLGRDRRALRLDAVALWIEERIPELRFALVSELETGGRQVLVRSDSTGAWPRLARARLARALVQPLVLSGALVLALVRFPSGARARAVRPHAGDGIDRMSLGTPPSDRLTPLAVRVIPPAYAHRSTSDLDDPATVRALPGSRVVVAGRGDAAGVSARVRGNAGGSLRASGSAAGAGGSGWSVELAARDSVVAVELTDGVHTRVLDVEPERDATPTVVLRRPLHDSVLAAPRGAMELAADAADDIGVAEAHFEIVISSGEGENFAFRTLTTGARRFDGRRVSFGARLALDSLRLHPGDVLHVRAVASDGNTVSGPGIGTSDTRVLRIARTGADDSLAITPAAPPDTNQSALSERMLIQLTQALARKRPALDRQTLLSEAHSISLDQQRLRRSVGDVVFARLGGQPSSEDVGLEQPAARGDSMRDMLARADRATAQSIQTLDFDGGETPVVAVNKPLLEAYNAMWDAGGALDQGDLDQAIPHMRTALAAIERSRQAERVYLGGREPDVVVDVAKARLQGRERGASSTRTPRPSLDAATDRLEARYHAILTVTDGAPSALADSLLLLRVDALAINSDFASALGRAADAIRHGQGDQATAALVRARRALDGAPIIRRSLAPWGGGFAP